MSRPRAGASALVLCRPCGGLRSADDFSPWEARYFTGRCRACERARSASRRTPTRTPDDAG